MAQNILYINMYIPVTGTAGAKHSSHIRLFKEITDFFLPQTRCQPSMFSEKYILCWHQNCQQRIM